MQVAAVIAVELRGQHAGEQSYSGGGPTLEGGGRVRVHGEEVLAVQGGRVGADAAGPGQPHQLLVVASVLLRRPCPAPTVAGPVGRPAPNAAPHTTCR